MRELTIGKNDAGVRLDRFVSKALPLLPPALMQKYIRIKRIKVNGARAQRDQRLAQGDVVQLYINDEFFDKPSEENLFLTLFIQSHTPWGITWLVMAFLLSPFGLPAVAEWLICKLDGLNYSLKCFITD